MCKLDKRIAKIVLNANTSIKKMSMLRPLTTPFPENLGFNKKKKNHPSTLVHE